MTDLTTAARALETRMRNDIPLTRAIDLRVRHADADNLILAAPLAPNVNDKGCAFGGSLVSLMTVAGWAHVVLALEARGLDCDVFVGRSEVVYRAPVWNDFEARATLADTADWPRFFDTLGKRGKARISVQCTIRVADSPDPCASLAADFVAKTRTPDHDAASDDASQ